MLPSLASMRDPMNATVNLFLAVQQNKELGIIQSLVESRADIHQSYRGATLLTKATQFADLETVKYLLSLDLNPREQNDQGHTAAHYACTRAPELSPLPKNIFFAFESERGALSICICFLAFAILLNSTVLATTHQPISASLHQFAPILHVGSLAPLNTVGCIFRESLSQKSYDLWRMANGIVALTVMVDQSVDLLPEVQLLPAAYFTFISLWLIHVGFQPKAIKSMAILTKIANLVIVTHLFSSGNPIYATGAFSLYYISCLDSEGRLPTSLQKIYYFGLRTIATPFDLLLKHLTK